MIYVIIIQNPIDNPGHGNHSRHWSQGKVWANWAPFRIRALSLILFVINQENKEDNGESCKLRGLKQAYHNKHSFLFLSRISKCSSKCTYVISILILQNESLKNQLAKYLEKKVPSCSQYDFHFSLHSTRILEHRPPLDQNRKVMPSKLRHPQG